MRACWNPWKPTSDLPIAKNPASPAGLTRRMACNKNFFFVCPRVLVQTRKKKIWTFFQQIFFLDLLV
jgi:hypothetical protein